MGRIDLSRLFARTLATAVYRRLPQHSDAEDGLVLSELVGLRRSAGLVRDEVVEFGGVISCGAEVNTQRCALCLRSCLANKTC